MRTFISSQKKLPRKIVLTVTSAIAVLFSSCGNEGNAQPGAPPTIKGSKITWDVQQNNNWYKPGVNNEFYVLLTLKGGSADEDKARTPLNISVVLDRSGSMDGDKIKYAQKAINFLIDQLDSKDKLSIVDYDDVVEIVSKQHNVQNKELLKSKVNLLTPRGSTNLSGGALEGYAQVNAMKQSGYVNRVLLLTDGLANAGISDPLKLKQIADNKFTGTGIGLSTFGVGADYNEDLLTMMAEAGRGNYYFIGQPDQIPDIFGKELKGLLNVVAQNTYVRFSLPRNIICEQVYGYPFSTDGKMVTINFNDVYANEEKVILLKLRSEAMQTEPFSISGTMNYTDAANFDTKSTSFSTVFHPSNDQQKIYSNANKNVEEMIALYRSTEELDRVIEDADKKDYGAARTKATKALDDIKQKQIAMPSAKLKAQEAKLEKYVNEMESIESRSEDEQKIIQKGVKEANYKTKKNK